MIKNSILSFVSDILFHTSLLPLAPIRDYFPGERGVLPYRGVRGVSGGKLQFTTDITLGIFYYILKSK